MASMLGNVQRVVAAVVHVVAAVHFPVVVFVAATIDAVHHVAVDTDGAFVPGLIGYLRRE